MSTKENVIEAIISAVNKHFVMEVEWSNENLPVVTSAKMKEANSTVAFINELIEVLEASDELDGKLNYYFGNTLDYDTPEEFHRH